MKRELKEKELKAKTMNWHGIKGRESRQRNKRPSICSLVLYQCAYERLELELGVRIRVRVRVRVVVEDIVEVSHLFRVWSNSDDLQENKTPPRKKSQPHLWFLPYFHILLS